VQRTRRQILDILKRKRTATLDDLAREIGLSAVTIRAHLSVLARDDLVTSEEVRGRIGRPHFAYSLAEGAAEHFPAAYHMVAHRFLEGFMAVASPDQMGRLVDHVADSWAAEYAGRFRGKGLEQRIEEAVRIRTEEGAMAEWEQSDGGYTIRQHNCPALRIASLHPEVCLAELKYVRRMLGVPVERETSMRAGAQQCSFKVSPQSA
jgi:predicted ArsR family transcriptional regulator